MSLFRKWLLLILVAVIFSLILFRQNISAKVSVQDEIPNWIEWNEQTIETENETILSINSKRLIVKNEMTGLYWQSDKEFFVQDVLSTNLDSDADEEIIVLLWKRGKYGKHRPFWITDADNSYSQHIFIYDIENDRVSQKWCTSELGRVIKRMKVMEKNNAIILFEDTDGNNTLWCWQGFGLKNIDNSVKIIAFGDNIIHKSIYEYAFNFKNGNFDFLYEPYKEEIAKADISAIQAETILVDKKEAVSGYPSFGSPIEVGDSIAKAGFDIVSCANNHCLDKGITGINTSTDFYEENGLICVGIQNSRDTQYKPYKIIKRNGISFAVFSYTYGTNTINAVNKYPYVVHYLPNSNTEESEFVKEIKEAGMEADFIIVFVHWGEEYSDKISNEQERITKLFKEANVDVVIGTHPHVIQDVKMIKRADNKNMLVYYSLGNFVSGKMKNKRANIGGEAVFTVEYTYEGVKIKDYEMKILHF
ncbi:CapA family protein [Butyrivibrio sp. AE3004]|uniref:CapA family protein n=1 Tax=Butyrivibrio sp. AE3004 TaxID=1506994 RepID=UPI00068E0310|nr:CapA family protein [Butyrivibrio sp. AE3004]